MTAVIILGWENAFLGALVFVNLPEEMCGSAHCPGAWDLQGCVNAQWATQTGDQK